MEFMLASRRLVQFCEQSIEERRMKYKLIATYANLYRETNEWHAN